MTPALLLILGIIDKALAIALEISESMPPESKAAFWERHEKNMAFWQGLFDRMGEQVKGDTDGKA